MSRPWWKDMIYETIIKEATARAVEHTLLYGSSTSTEEPVGIVQAMNTIELGKDEYEIEDEEVKRIP